MNYLEKERLILDKLRETDYAIFGGSKDDALSFVSNSLLAIIEYQNTIVRTNIIKATYDDGNAKKDNERAFKQATDGIDALNILCRELGLKPFMSTTLINMRGFRTTISDYTSELFAVSQSFTI